MVWPGGDLALFGILAYVLVVSALTVGVLQRIRQGRDRDPRPISEPVSAVD